MLAHTTGRHLRNALVVLKAISGMAIAIEGFRGAEPPVSVCISHLWRNARGTDRKNVADPLRSTTALKSVEERRPHDPPKTHPRPTSHAMTPDPQHFDPPKAEKPNEINPPLGKCPINRKVSAKCPLEKCVRVRYIAAQPMKCLFLLEALMNQNDTKTHCKHGHLFDEANTYHYRGTRICKACRDRRNKETPSQRVTRRAAERKAKDEARSAALLAREGGAELTRAKLLTAHIADLETQLSDARSALKRLVIRRFCTRGHEIPADRDKCGQCAKRGAIARFYAKKKQATRPTP